MSLDRLQHKELAKRLIKACGGTNSIIKMDITRVCKSVLNGYKCKTDRSIMPADVIADLEAYCGEPIYSGFIAAQHGVSPAESLLQIVSEVDFLASDTQRELIRSLSPDSDGGERLTENERQQLVAKMAECAAAIAKANATLKSESE